MTAAELVYQGSDLYNAGKPAEAMGYFDKALELDPKNAEVLVRKRTALYALGRREEALQYCYRTLAIDPKNVHRNLNGRYVRKFVKPRPRSDGKERDNLDAPLCPAKVVKKSLSTASELPVFPIKEEL